VSDARADFTAVYAKHGPQVYRFALYLSGEPAEAEDIAAETFARAWTSPTPLRNETVRAYLLTIARNVWVQRARRAGRQEPLSDSLLDTKSPEAGLEARAELRAVRAQLLGMSSADRTALLLRADGNSYEEIAAVLGGTPAAARVRVHRVRAVLLRARLEGTSS
jgi:RNA polymerase sigma-70 factor (ECF subfamily)